MVVEKVGFVYDPIYLKHNTGMHVENANRASESEKLLEKSGIISKLEKISAQPATIEQIAAVHHREYISYVENYATNGGGWLDADTVISPESYEVALYAAGGAIKAVDAVMDEAIKSGFCLVRPPGHHATESQAMGFCIFNNVAIAARHLINRYKLDKILIVDFDVHHGNGTQEAFYTEPRVLYFSTHQWPFYPGTGAINEVGEKEAKGTNVNIPLPGGCGDKEYLRVFQEIFIPVVRRYQPQFILVSAGYDIHWADQIALMQVSISGIVSIVKIIKALAQELCRGRLVFSLEGGYNIQALSNSIKATMEVLLGNEDIYDPLGAVEGKVWAPDITDILSKVKRTHNLT